jgi:hypothetical protein
MRATCSALGCEGAWLRGVPWWRSSFRVLTVRGMSQHRERVLSFIRLVEGGQSLDSMRQFYSPDVMIFENRELARAGLDACLAFESKMLASQPAVPSAKAVSFAADDATATSFVEWLIRFTSKSGRPMRLEEVAVQKWERGKIVQERFYYEGFVDEGD